MWRTVFLNTVNLLFFVTGCLILGFAILVFLDLRKVPDLAFLENYQPVSHLQIYDSKDQLICNIEGIEKRTIIPLHDVTPHLQRAVLSAEDRHFYQHSGLDFIGITRATLANIVARRTVQGGSTITQQLAKNLFFEDHKRSLVTKVAEAVVAAQLEAHYSKEKILELYLNEVYFGRGAYGIEQAANIYFNKPASDLSIAESAYIAGLIKWPARGGQARYADANLRRQKEVLDKMHEYGYISEGQTDAAKRSVLVFQTRTVKPTQTTKVTPYPYYISYVLEQVRQLYTEGEMQRHGLRIYTHMDRSAQTAAEKALTTGINQAPAGCTQGALVSINVKDGAVVALVGGVGDFLKHQWNCATNPHTTGSSFKPFVYLAGFNRGTFDPDTIIEDTPISIAQENQPDYKPKNYDGKYMGKISVAEALAYSRNTCAIRAAQMVGVNNVIETAMRAGVKQKPPQQIAIALGCSAASPLEMGNAYATLARGGIVIEPSVLRRIDDKHGNTLRAFYNEPHQVFSQKPVANLVDILQDVVSQGTGTQASLGDRPVAGKTGTSDQAKDLWFVGFTPDLVTAVWGGNPDNKPIAGSHVTGGTVMARIWRNYNRAYYATHEVPPGWFVACNRLSGNFKFKQRTPVDATRLEQEKPAQTEADTSAPSTPAASATPAATKVVRYEDIDPGYREHAAQRAVRQRPSHASRSAPGVTEYRW